MQKFCFQCQFQGKGLWNNSGSSVKLSDKKFQNGRQNSRWLPISIFFRITSHHNVCTIEHRMVVLVNISMFISMIHNLLTDRYLVPKWMTLTFV